MIDISYSRALYGYCTLLAIISHSLHGVSIIISSGGHIHALATQKLTVVNAAFNDAIHSGRELA